MADKPKILITGGLGNLGSWLTDHLLNHNYDVWVLAQTERQLAAPLPYNFIQCDISDYEECQSMLGDSHFELVIHTASLNDGFVEGYFTSANQVNVLGTRNLLEVFKDKGLKHFLYFSTFQVYGKYDGTIDESTPTKPRNDYGSTHLFAEFYIKQFHFTHELPFTIIRLTNSYGCPKDYKSSKWYLILNDLSKSAFDNGEIVLKSNGQSQRDFIWMGSVAQCVQDLIEKKATNEIYNLSGQRTFNMVEVAEMVQSAYRNKYDRNVSISVNQKDQTQYPQDLRISSEKLRTVVKINDEIRFEQEATNVFEFLEKENK